MDTPKEQGIIVGDAVYTLLQVKSFGLGTAAIRTARRKGLKVRRVGRKSFILGRDLVDYLENHAAIVQ